MSFFAIHTAQAQSSLIVNFKNDSQAGFLVNTLNKITFSGGSLLLKTTDTPLNTYLISDIRKLTFGVYSGFSAISIDPTALVVYPNPATNFIYLKNSPEGEINITVFRLDGAVLISKKLKNGLEQIDVSNLSKGLYLLRVNNKTLKFMKQ